MRRPALTLLLLASLPSARADQARVVYRQGFAHGFVEVTTLDGKRIAIGDLTRRLRGNVVTSRLTIIFLDGSVDDETTIFSQDKVFRLIRDHHVQRGSSFPNPIDVAIDVVRDEVVSTDEHGKITRTRMQMPADISNGLTLTIVMNLLSTARKTRISVLSGTKKPRLVHLSIKHAGDVPFTLGGMPRRATDYSIHVELGGVAGVVAPLVGSQPPDYHILITAGADPAFLREQGPFYEGGPIWCIQQVSATFPKNGTVDQKP